MLITYPTRFKNVEWKGWHQCIISVRVITKIIRKDKAHQKITFSECKTIKMDILAIVSTHPHTRYE